MLGADPTHTSRTVDWAPSAPQPLWRARLDGGIYASPVASGHSVFIVAHDQQVRALDAASGREQWIFSAGAAISATPLLVGGVVVVAAKDGRVTALDRSTGKRRWEISTGGAVLSSPVAEDGVVYFGSNDLNLYAVRVTDGIIMWKYFANDYKYGGLYGSPGLDRQNVYIGAKNGVLHAVSRQSGHGVWQATLGSSIYGPPLVARGRIYIGAYDRGLYAIDASNGRVIWRAQLDDWPQGGAVLIEPLVYIAARSGILYALRADDGVVAWSRDLGGELRHGLAVGANGIGVIGVHPGKVLGIEMETGRTVWQVAVAGPVFGQPALANRMLYVATIDGEVSAWR